MRLRAPLRIAPATASAGLCITMGLLPSLWVSWQAPIARGIVLPVLAILTLTLLLPREEPESQELDDTGRTTAATRGASPVASRLTAFLRRLLRPLLALVNYPALLYLVWGA